MPSQIVNYKCPRCMGFLHFEDGKLRCDYCGGAFDVVEIEENMRTANARASAVFDSNSSGGWDASGLNDDWGDEARNLRTYSCPSCGAELICESSTAATSCPYCNNPAVAPGQFSGSLRPNFVIPFRVDKKSAVAALKKHCQGKLFLPGTFRDENHIKEIQGVYIPFWLFDGEATAEAEFDASRSSTRTEGKYEVTTTSHYRARRAGSVAFEKVPVDALSKMPDDLMDSIEPYDYASCQPFSTAYLPGFLANRYDVPLKDCLPRAEARCENSILQMLENTVRGYDSLHCVSHSVSIRKGAVHYALMPVWILNTHWNGKDFIFAMNGQTGKFVGNLPLSWKKFFLTFAGIAVPLAALMAAFLYR